MPHPHRLGESVFSSPPPTPSQESPRRRAPTGFGQGRLTRPPDPTAAAPAAATPEPEPQERTGQRVQELLGDLDEMYRQIQGQINSAQREGRDIQRIFGPGSGVQNQIERHVGTLREALGAANMDESKADRVRELFLGLIPLPQTQTIKTAPGEDIQVITAGAGGGRTVERIGGTAPLPTVVPQASILAETRTGRVLTRGRPAPRKADTKIVKARDKDGNIFNVLVNKATGDFIGPIGPVGPELRFEPQTVPGVGREELAKLDEAEIGATNAIQGALKLRQAVLEGGAEVLGSPGVLSGLAQGFVSQTLGFAQLVGVNVGIFESGASADEAETKADTIFARIDEAGTINAEIRSAIVNLAFAAAAASGQTGRGVSDRDYERFVRELGAGASKPAVFASVLTKFAQRISGNFATRFKVKMRRVPGSEKLAAPDLFKEVFGDLATGAAATGGTLGGGERRAANLPENTTATNPDTGEKLIVRGGKWVSQ